MRVGFGGYQDAMWGVSFTIGSDKESWGCGSFQGHWSYPPSEGAKWTDESRIKKYGEVMNYLLDLCKKAKVEDVMDLVGVPIEATFDGSLKLVSWRILEEVV